jgi:hypothetical protein
MAIIRTNALVDYPKILLSPSLNLFVEIQIEYIETDIRHYYKGDYVVKYLLFENEHLIYNTDLSILKSEMAAKRFANAIYKKVHYEGYGE